MYQFLDLNVAVCFYVNESEIATGTIIDYDVLAFEPDTPLKPVYVVQWLPDETFPLHWREVVSLNYCYPSEG